MSTEQNDLGVQDTSMGSPAVQQRMYTDEDVNRIVAGKLKRQAEAQQVPAQPQVDIDSLKRQLKAEVTEDLRRENENAMIENANRQWQGVLQDYYGRLHRHASSGESPDFDSKMKSFNHNAYANVIAGAMEYDNTATIMEELSDNPSKTFMLNQMAQTDPLGFKKEMDKLSKSIADNKKAKDQAKEVNAPLSHIKPNSVGAESGPMSLKDYKKMFVKTNNPK